MVNRYDVAIVGAGIIGLMTARELARYDLEVVVFDKNVDVACGTTKANGGIIHPGYHARPDSLMARLNVEGNRLYRDLVAELEVDFHETGSLMVAFEGDDLNQLEKYYDQARRNGVPGVEILGRDQVLERAPKLNPAVAVGLYAATTGMVSPYELAIACAENSSANGIEFMLATTVKAIMTSGQRVTGVSTDKGEISADWVINAGGLFADELSRTAGDDSFRIHPRKGEIIILDRKLGWLARPVIYPMPTPESKGVVIVPTVEGNTALASTAVDIEDKSDFRTSDEGRAELLANMRRIFPAIPADRNVIAQFTGLRAVAEGDDFIIGPSAAVKGLINVAGIQSPGLASAPAIARMVVDILREEGLPLRPRACYKPKRRGMARIMNLGYEEIAGKYKEDQRYGSIICRCERISEAEVVEAIKRPLGAKTLDGIKRRTRAQTGRCQGAYCTCRLMEILARELQVPLDRISKDGYGSEMLVGPTKSLISHKSD